MGCDFLGYVYGRVRHFVRTCSGRKRYNVLGALNFVTKKLITVTNDTYITATQVCELLRKISDEYVGTPIYLVLDNASYQKCQVVWALATELGINLVYIPSYSPNLNLIERLWKFVKGKLRTQYYDDFNIFMEKINSITDSTDKEYKQAIDNLVSDNIQFFHDLLPVENNPYLCIPQPRPLVA
jgi:transposase